MGTLRSQATENRERRARRQPNAMGYGLRKSGVDTYLIFDATTNGLTDGPSLSLDDIETLTAGYRRAAEHLDSW